MPSLSFLIPARNEEWLSQTVADVLAHTSELSEIIVVLDGAWPTTPLSQHERVQVVYLPEPIGQRAATNLAARISTAPYICKVDAHVSVLPDFDRVLLDSAKELGPHVMQVPAQRGLHVYNQVCPTCQPRFCVDQAPSLPDCPRCHGPLVKELVWKPRRQRPTTGWRFDADLHFQYGLTQPDGGDYPETMSLLGACWFLSREWFWTLGGCDEAHGSWGQQGTEMACKVWLSGGRVVCNTKTQFAHFFRVGGIGFPYPITGRDQEKAREHSRNLWRSNGWPGQVRPLRWLVEKFRPAGWTEEQIASLPDAVVGVAQPVDPDVQPFADEWPGDAPKEQAEKGSDSRVHSRSVAPTRGIVYYSDCRPDPAILIAAADSIEASGLPIVAVTLKPIDWLAARNIVMDAERGYLTMFRQILAGLEALDTDYAFLCEHDVVYHPSHFAFVPPRDDTYYYALNVVKVDAATGRAVSYDTKQTSGLCANRQLLVEHYRARVARVEAEGFSRRMGFEPGSHRRAERIDDVPSDVWRSEYPNLDIRHDKNLTASRWSPSEFRDPKHCQHWQELEVIPGWGRASELSFVQGAVGA